jgi:hypothetical protein
VAAVRDGLALVFDVCDTLDVFSDGDVFGGAFVSAGVSGETVDVLLTALPTLARSRSLRRNAFARRMALCHSSASSAVNGRFRDGGSDGILIPCCCYFHAQQVISG